VASNRIGSTNEDDTACSGGFDAQLVTWLQPGAPERVDGNRRLVLCADPRLPARSSSLY